MNKKFGGRITTKEKLTIIEGYLSISTIKHEIVAKKNFFDIILSFARNSSPPPHKKFLLYSSELSPPPS